ncbi:cytochrome P450 27C1-like [Haliotis rubra]|uniref:cytochrome P450 27C1-like n=1 Tax=Haliotis rubra TaxID=36100 RepID=UPI001EE6066C|nr:cytochrome P450 27C1-like [Haliotis rubra]
MAESVLRRVASHGRTLLVRGHRNSAGVRRVFTEASESSDLSLTDASPRSFEDLPGPTGLPVVGTLPEYFRKANKGQMHEVQRRTHKKYGKIFKEPFGPVTNLSVADPSLVEEILRSEGKYPFRPPYQSWQLYNEMRNKKGGIMTAQGEQWKRCRSAMNPKLLRPKSVGEYVNGINDVVASFMERLRYLKDVEGDGQFVPHLPNELNKFTMETLTWVILETRLGCLEKDTSPRIQDFIKSVATMFLTGHKLVAFASVHKLLRTKIWRDHVQAWDTIYDIATEHIDKKLLEVESRLAVSEPQEGERVDFLTYLVKGKNLTKEEINNNIAEILLWGVDTAANSLSFLVYALAKNPHVQDKLRDEVDHVVDRRTANYEDLQNMPYLKAVIKETLRLYPPIPINARVTQEEIVVDNYLIPKGTCILLNNYTMSRDEKIFSNPDKFVPERWLREEAKDWHPFSAIPFGYGARSCVGRRIAETEMYLATIQLCQNFCLQLSDKFDITPSVRTQLTPGPELPVLFNER